MDYWALDSVELPDQQLLTAPVIELLVGSVRHLSVADVAADQRSKLVPLRTHTQHVNVLDSADSDEPLRTHTQHVDVLDSANLSPAARLALVKQSLNDMQADDTQLTSLVAAMQVLPLGVLKSLLQLIIRSGARNVCMTGTRLPDGTTSPIVRADVLLSVVAVAMLSKSAFNPDGGGLERGIAALCKRGVICAVEDAWPTGEEASLEWMMCCAALASARRHWNPTVAHVMTVIRVLQACLRSRSACVFSSADGARIPVSTAPPMSTADFHRLSVVAYMFDHFVGGMKGDRAMLRDFARRVCAGEEWLKPAPTNARVDVIAIEHCLDQHCATTLVYLLPPGGAAMRLLKSDGHPCRSIFAKMFAELKGLNPRRVANPRPNAVTLYDLMSRNDEQARFFSEIHAAQRRLWLSLLCPDAVTPICSDRTGTIKVSQPYERLAQLVGPRYVNPGQHKYVWTLGIVELAEINVARLHSKSVIRASSGSSSSSSSSSSANSNGKRQLPQSGRSADENDDDDDDGDEEDQMIAEIRAKVLRELAETGVKLPEPLGRVKMALDATGLPIITLDGVEWKEKRKSAIEVPVSDWIGVLPVDSLCTPRMSIDLVHYRARLSAVIDSVENVTPAARHLALSMLRSNDEMLAFPRPDRDGDCGGAFMTRLHHEAWHVLKAVSDMCALLIRPRGGLALSQFETRRDLVDLRIQVFSRLPGGVSRTLSPAKAVEAGRCVKLWFNGRTGLAPRKQQERALMQLLYRVVDCRSRAHFLWMNMGAGKTFVSLLFGAALCALYGLRPGAMKVLFVTAASAIETVVKDARQLDLVHCVLSSKYDARQLTAERMHSCQVIFVTHDLIKRIDVLDQLSDYASSALVVIDEVHVCSGRRTQRSTAVQLLANTARQLLMMTATPLRRARERANLYELLKHVANFQCRNERDFMVACGAITRVPISDTVPTELELVSAENDQNRALLLRHIPARLGGTSPQDRFDAPLFRAALTDAFLVTDQYIVSCSMREIKAGRRPLVVARNQKHCRELIAALLAKGLRDANIWRFDENKPLESLPAAGNERSPIRVGVLPISACLGFSATHFNVRIRGVFPSNEASRSQMDGRIARTGQPVRPVRLITVYCGITGLILNNHLETASLVRLMEQLNACARVD